MAPQATKHSLKLFREGSENQVISYEMEFSLEYANEYFRSMTSNTETVCTNV